MVMSWSIADVARMSGVTSRTLRHYDEIGLLPPAWTGAGGYRYYEEDDLLRLQQILVLRELGLGLSEIAAILDQQADEVEALRAYHQRLLAERDRLDVLASTVARTIAELQDRKGHEGMSKINRPENLFAGFDASRTTPKPASGGRSSGSSPSGSARRSPPRTPSGCSGRRPHG
jgi:DNA-binding transcriptional MerR regulator